MLLNSDHRRHWRGRLKAHPKSNRFSLAPKSHAQNRMDRQISQVERQSACTRFLLNSTGPLVPNGVRENELVKAEIFKSEIHYRSNCFGHQSSTPIPSGEPKSSVLGSAWSPKL